MGLNYGDMSLVQVLIYLGAFGIVAVASGQIAGVFQQLKLPLITGFLMIGLVSGPELFGIIDEAALSQLHFLNDISLAFIAFAVGSELYAKELRSRIRSIISMTISQILASFIIVSLSVYLLSSFIPFFNGMTLMAKSLFPC